MIPLTPNFSRKSYKPVDGITRRQPTAFGQLLKAFQGFKATTAKIRQEEDRDEIA